MLTVRPAEWPGDLTALSRLDTSFVTGTVYRPMYQGLAFRLREEAVDPPLRKEYPFWPLGSEESAGWEHAVVALADGELAGFAEAEYAVWNRRVVVRHLYVAPEHRGAGVGTRLLEEMDRFAREAGAWCLWLETQNTNAPAVRFYLRRGFRWCGFDESLYDPAGPVGNEVALFFSRPVSGSSP